MMLEVLGRKKPAIKAEPINGAVQNLGARNVSVLFTPEVSSLPRLRNHNQRFRCTHREDPWSRQRALAVCSHHFSDDFAGLKDDSDCAADDSNDELVTIPDSGDQLHDSRLTQNVVSTRRYNTWQCITV